MADLFDVNAAGAGFHITSHMIAIVALFVACFAITGYITFRDDSISRTKLEPGIDDYTVSKTTVAIPIRAVATAANTVNFQIVQPANTSIVSYNTYVTDAFTVGAPFTVVMGTTPGGAEVTGGPGGALVAQTVAAGATTVNTDTGLISIGGPVYTPTERTLTFRVAYTAASAVTEGGSFDLVVTFVHV